MLQFDEITIRNFYSFGNVPETITLNTNDLILVFGENLDSNHMSNGEEKGRRNGVGKSAIFQALVFGLYGKSIGNDIKVSNLINDKNNKMCEVFIDFTKDGKKYRVERGRSPTFFDFYEVESGDDNTRGEMNSTQEDLNKVLGISQLLFEYTVVLNTTVDIFFKMGASKQRDFIEELVNINQLTEKGTLLKDMAKETKRLADNEQFKIKTTIESNEKIEHTIKTFQTQVEGEIKQHEVDLNTKLIELNSYDGVDFDELIKTAKEIQEIIEYNKNVIKLHDDLSFLEQKLNDFDDQTLKQKESVKKELDKLNDFDFEAELIAHSKYEEWIENENNIKKVESDKKLVSTEISRFNSEISLLKIRLQKMESELKDLEDEVCPTCKQEFHTSNIIDVKNKLMTDISSLNEQINDKTNSLNEAQVLLDSYIVPLTYDKPSTVYKSVIEVEKMLLKIESLTQQLNDIPINPYIQMVSDAKINLEGVELKQVPDFEFTLDTLYTLRSEKERIESDILHINDNIVNKGNNLKQQLTTLKNSLVDVNTHEYDRLSKIAEHQDFLSKLLLNKDSFIRKDIIDANIAFLNSRLAHYVERSGSEQQVTFTSDLSVDITKFGRSYDFGQLSRGERGRVKIALNLAFRDTYESLNQSINLLVIDEMIDDGLDPAGIDCIYNVLNDISSLGNKSLFIVSHREELMNKADMVLKIVKENEFSHAEIINISDI